MRLVRRTGQLRLAKYYFPAVFMVSFGYFRAFYYYDHGWNLLVLVVHYLATFVAVSAGLTLRKRRKYMKRS